jgi:hypothetical protein
MTNVEVLPSFPNPGNDYAILLQRGLKSGSFNAIALNAFESPQSKALRNSLMASPDRPSWKE